MRQAGSHFGILGLSWLVQGQGWRYAPGVKLLAADLDGTLTRDGFLGAEIREVFDKLGKNGVTRVIATGRLFPPLRDKILPPDFPVDYVIYSTGAGIVHWPSQKHLRIANIEVEQSRLVGAYFIERGLSFMSHDCAPENHTYQYWRGDIEEPDFERRLDRIRSWGRQWETKQTQGCSQFLTVVPLPQVHQWFEDMQTSLAKSSVIRATSPLDNRSVWLEIFSGGVNKGLALKWLADSININRDDVLAVGNDYNDMEFLQWAGEAWLVQNSPQSMHKLFAVTDLPAEEGFCELMKRLSR